MEYKSATTHEEWLVALRGIARAWHNKYYFLDEDEIFSELLVTYSEALATYNESRGVKFDTYFYYQKKKALLYMLREASYGRNEHDEEIVVNVKDEILNNLAADIDIVDRIIEDLDKVELDADTKSLLEYIAKHGVETGERARIGKNTVVTTVVKNLGWTYARAKAAVASLETYYKGAYCVA